MNMLPDDAPHAAVQPSVPTSLLPSGQGEGQLPLLGRRTTAKTTGQDRSLADLQSLPAELINRIGAELDPVDLCNLAASSERLARTVDTRRFTQMRNSFYGEPGSLQAMASYRQFYAVHNRFKGTAHQALFGQSQSEQQPEQVLDCALGLRIKSQTGALKPACRSFKKAIVSPVWPMEWAGSIAGLGQCRISTLLWTERNGFHLPVQRLDPYQGIIDLAPLQLSPPPMAETLVRSQASSLSVPPLFLKVNVLQDGTVVACHAVAIQLWYLGGIADGESPLSDTLPVQNATAVADMVPGRIAIGCDSGHIQVWSLSPKKCIQDRSALHRSQVNGLITLPDDRLVSASVDGSLVMWRGELDRVMASSRLPQEDNLLDIKAILPDRFITHSTCEVLHVWQVTWDGFHCIAMLNPFPRSFSMKDQHDHPMAERLRLFWCSAPFLLQCNITTLANNMAVRVSSRRGAHSRLSRLPPPVLELYDLNAAQGQQEVQGVWRSMDMDTAVPIWEPRPLAGRACDDTIVLLKALPDGRIVVASRRRLVICEPSSGHILEVSYRSENEAVCQHEQPPCKPLAGGCVSDDGFIWLYDRQGTAFLIDLFADISATEPA